MMRLSIYQSTAGFFGLTPSHRPVIHEDIFTLCYYGKGFTHAHVYDMPLYLRKFYLHQVNLAVKRQNDANSGKESENTRPKVHRPPGVNS